MNPDEQSEITLGGYDSKRFEQSTLNWHKVVKKLFWAVKLDDVKVNGVSTGFCTRSGANCTICPDSGTSLLTFPPAALKEFNKKYGDTVDCTEDEFLKLPELTYVIDGIEYGLPSHHWASRKTNEKSSKGGKCSSSVAELSVGQDGLEEMFILGDAFMQEFYTIHDAENDRVGFAKAVH